MREIIYKGKSIEENNKGDWVYGYYFSKTNPKTENGFPLAHCISDLPPFGYEIDVDTLGEYIGLKDKKNDRVFSGDIIKFGTQQYEIKWNDEQCCFGFWTGNAWQSGCNKDTIAMAEIIGNIHDKD